MEGSTGQQTWGWLLGEGESRGIALIFAWAGVLTSLIAAIALLTPTYRTLVRSFRAATPQEQDQAPNADGEQPPHPHHPPTQSMPIHPGLPAP